MRQLESLIKNPDNLDDETFRQLKAKLGKLLGLGLGLILAGFLCFGLAGPAKRFGNLGVIVSLLMGFAFQISAIIVLSKGIIFRKKAEADYYFSKGFAAGQNQNWREAVEFLNQVLERQKNHVQAHYLIALAYCGLLDKDSALEHYFVLKNFDRNLADQLDQNLVFTVLRNGGNVVLLDNVPTQSPDSNM